MKNVRILITPLHFLMFLLIVASIGCAKKSENLATMASISDLAAGDRSGDYACDCEYQFYSVSVQPATGYPDYNVELNTIQNVCGSSCLKMWGAYSALNLCPKTGACVSNVSGQVDTTVWLPFNCAVNLYEQFTITTAVQLVNSSCGKTNAPYYTIGYRVRCRELGINLPNCASDHYKWHTSPVVWVVDPPGAPEYPFMDTYIGLNECGCTPLISQ